MHAPHIQTLHIYPSMFLYIYAYSLHTGYCTCTYSAHVPLYIHKLTPMHMHTSVYTQAPLHVCTLYTHIYKTLHTCLCIHRHCPACAPLHTHMHTHVPLITHPCTITHSTMHTHSSPTYRFYVRSRGLPFLAFNFGISMGLFESQFPHTEIPNSSAAGSPMLELLS